MGLGIGGGLGPFRVGVSTRGFGVGVGPLSATGGWRRRRRRQEPEAPVGVLALIALVLGVAALFGGTAEAPDPKPTTDIAHQVRSAAGRPTGLIAAYRGRGWATLKRSVPGEAVVELECPACGAGTLSARSYTRAGDYGSDMAPGLNLINGDGTATAGIEVTGNDDDADWTVRIWRPGAVLDPLAPGGSVHGTGRQLLAVAAGVARLTIRHSDHDCPSARVFTGADKRYVQPWDADDFDVSSPAVVEVSGDNCGVGGRWTATAH